MKTLPKRTAQAVREALELDPEIHQKKAPACLQRLRQLCPAYYRSDQWRSLSSNQLTEIRQVREEYVAYLETQLPQVLDHPLVTQADLVEPNGESWEKNMLPYWDPGRTILEFHTQPTYLVSGRNYQAGSRIYRMPRFRVKLYYHPVDEHFNVFPYTQDLVPGDMRKGLQRNYGHPHPHVTEDGITCSGSTSFYLHCYAYATGDLVAGRDIMLEFLHNYDPHEYPEHWLETRFSHREVQPTPEILAALGVPTEGDPWRNVYGSYSEEDDEYED